MRGFHFFAVRSPHIISIDVRSVELPRSSQSHIFLQPQPLASLACNKSSMKQNTRSTKSFSMTRITRFGFGLAETLLATAETGPWLLVKVNTDNSAFRPYSTCSRESFQKIVREHVQVHAGHRAVAGRATGREDHTVHRPMPCSHVRVAGASVGRGLRRFQQSSHLIIPHLGICLSPAQQLFNKHLSSVRHTIQQV